MNGKAEESGANPPLGAGETMSVFSSSKVKLLHSRELFADAREVVIEHDGELYRLRPTKKGKLILTK